MSPFSSALTAAGPPPNFAETARSAEVMFSQSRPNGCVQLAIPALTSIVEPDGVFAKDASSVTSKPEPRSTWAAVESAALTVPPPNESESSVGDVNEIQSGSTVLPDEVGKVAARDSPVRLALCPSRSSAFAALPRLPVISISDPAGQPKTSVTEDGRSSTAILAVRLRPPANSIVSGTVP